MAACEKCWADACSRVMHRGGAVVERYDELMIERADSPCTPQEQAGQWWSEEKQPPQTETPMPETNEDLGRRAVVCHAPDAALDLIFHSCTDIAPEASRSARIWCGGDFCTDNHIVGLRHGFAALEAAP